jgi:hypothetical protein
MAAEQQSIIVPVLCLLYRYCFLPCVRIRRRRKTVRSAEYHIGTSLTRRSMKIIFPKLPVYRQWFYSVAEQKLEENESFSLMEREPRPNVSVF